LFEGFIFQNGRQDVGREMPRRSGRASDGSPVSQIRVLRQGKTDIHTEFPGCEGPERSGRTPFLACANHFHPERPRRVCGSGLHDKAENAPS